MNHVIIELNNGDIMTLGNLFALMGFILATALIFSLRLSSLTQTSMFLIFLLSFSGLTLSLIPVFIYIQFFFPSSPQGKDATSLVFFMSLILIVYLLHALWKYKTKKL